MQRVFVLVPLIPLLIAVPTLLCAGCAPDCGDVSEKIVEQCDLLWQQNLGAEDFERQCREQEEHYEDDPDAAEAFQTHLECLMSTDCDALEQDETLCSDGEIYIYL